MKKHLSQLSFLTLVCLFIVLPSKGQGVKNPLIFADVPDIAMMRVGDT